MRNIFGPIFQLYEFFQKILQNTEIAQNFLEGLIQPNLQFEPQHYGVRKKLIFLGHNIYANIVKGQPFAVGHMTVNGNKAEIFDFESREWIEQAEYPYEEK